MNRGVGAVRFAGAELDFATWYAHLAGRPAAGRAIFERPRRELTPVERRWVEPLDLASWRARLSGTARKAA